LWYCSPRIINFNLLSSGQRVLEEFEQKLKEEEQRRDDSAEKLERASNVLVSVKAGVEHLADKLLHLKIVSGLLYYKYLSSEHSLFFFDYL